MTRGGDGRCVYRFTVWYIYPPSSSVMERIVDGDLNKGKNNL
jgi:hypothetical protein